MERIRSWLTGATLAAAGIRLALAVAASLAAGGEPLVALCAALAAEWGAADALPPLVGKPFAS